MKLVRIFVAFLVVLFVHGTTMSQNWKKVVSESFPTFYDVCFANTSTGWVVGLSGAIYKTTNGGTNWTAQTSNTTNTLNVVFCLDANNGFAGGANRTLLKTTNGGTTWSIDTVKAITDTDAGIRSIYFADAQRGWILSTRSSANGRILHTTDGGANWTVDLTVSSVNLIDMHFYEANKGIAVGKNNGTLYYTTDGVTWTKSADGPLGGFIYTRTDVRSVYMANATTAYAVGWGSTVGLQPSILLKTTDAGATWTYLTQTEADRTYDNLYNVWFKDAQNGFAVGGGARGSIVLRTTNGGTRWEQLDPECGATINSVTGIGDKVWIAGSAGVIAYTPDFGVSGGMLTPIPSSTLYGMQFTSAMIGYAAGFDGVLLKTTNGGASWHGSYVSTNKLAPNIQDIYFVNDNVGYAAQSYRVVAKTTDGGGSWSQVIPDTTVTTVSSNGVYFLDQNTGFVVGQLSSTLDVIYKTTDGGGTWTTTSGKVSKALRGVGFGSATVGAVVGDALKALYTTDGGTTWSASTFNNVPSSLASSNLRRVVFLNATTAIAVGNKIILKSTNGGASWDYVNVTSNTLLYSVKFKDATTGWAVGSGEVWKTTDGGTTWSNTIDASVVTGSLYSVGVDKSGYVWIGSSSSAIYTNSPVVSVEEPGVAIPETFSLLQNFPNPFNPSTIIRYQMPVSAHIKVKVYDILGRLVTTLVDATQTAGEHQVAFDASGLASGTYVYTLESNNLRLAKAMMLVR